MIHAESGRCALLVGHCELVVQAARAMATFGWSFAALEGGDLELLKGRGLEIVSLPGASPRLVVACPNANDRMPNSGNVPVILYSGCHIADGNATRQVCSELVSVMRSGLGILTRTRGEDGLFGTPFLPAGHLAAFFGGLHVAFMAETVARSNLSGIVVEVSLQEALLELLYNAAGFSQLEDRDVARDADPRQVGGMFRCTDGDVLISLPDAHHWETLLHLLGDPVWADGGWWRNATLRFENRDLLNGAIADWCKDRQRLFVFNTLQSAGVPAAYVASAEDARANPQSAAVAKQLPHRVTALMPLPDSGQLRSGTTSGSALLGDVRIADFSWAWSGPYLTQCIAALGGTVTKVESAAHTDMHRIQPPILPLEEGDALTAVGHLVTNAGKRSVLADLKRAPDMQFLRELLRDSDIVISNFSPGVMERLALGFEDVCKEVGEKPLVYLALSGFGSEGPWARYRSYGMHLGALTGLARLTGDDSSGPVSIAIPFADPLGGIYGAVAALQALQLARTIGRPVKVEISQFEVMLLAIKDALNAGVPQANLRIPDVVPSGVHQALGQDEWVAVSVAPGADVETLSRLVKADASAGESLEFALKRWCAPRSAGAAERDLLAAGLSATAVRSPAELLSDPHLNGSGFWRTLHYRGCEVTGPALPWLIDGRRPPVPGAAPELGEHTRILLEELGVEAAVRKEILHDHD